MPVTGEVWRDPDSNRGHHDFQEVAYRQPPARNPWKSNGSAFVGGVDESRSLRAFGSA
jgi:hypothetical protein